MSIFKFATKAVTGAVLAAVFAASGAVSAQAITLQWTITNSFGSTLFLDRSSCSTGGSVSAPFSISSGSTVTFTGTSNSSSDLCNVRYHGGSLNQYGCQFQVQTNGITGFASTNAYKGTGNPQSPTCTWLGEGGIGGGYQGTFRMN